MLTKMENGQYVIIFMGHEGDLCPGQVVSFYYTDMDSHDEAACSWLMNGRHSEGSKIIVVGNSKTFQGEYLKYGSTQAVEYTIVRTEIELPELHSEACHNRSADEDSSWFCDCPTYPEGTDAHDYYMLTRMCDVWPDTHEDLERRRLQYIASWYTRTYLEERPKRKPIVVKAPVKV